MNIKLVTFGGRRNLKLPRAWSYIEIMDHRTDKILPVRAHFERDEKSIRIYFNGSWKTYEDWEEVKKNYFLPLEVMIDGKKYIGNTYYEWFDEQGRPNGDINFGGCYVVHF